MHRIISLSISFLLFTYGSIAQNQPLTVAEQSNYKSTANYDQIMGLIEALDQQSDRLKVENIGQTIEGRDIPLLILADPMPDSPESLQDDPRAVIYVQANIHAGEVEGKEASLMLARDLMADSLENVFENLIILICPNLNADGNEKISTANRTHQNGPDNGVGIRYNGQNLDLNRDALKLESPEMIYVVQNILNRWDPAITVDCHTTNGSFHEEPITFTWMMNPNGDSTLIHYMRDEMMPRIHQHLGNHYNTLNCFYGEFVDRMKPEQGWISYASEPRYMVNYIGVRNRLAILNENYVYADYKSRVLGCHKLLWSIVDYAVENRNAIKQLIAAADARTIARIRQKPSAATFALEYEGRPTPEPATIRAYEAEMYYDETGRKRYTKTDRQRTVTVPYIADYVPTKTIALPQAYALTVNDPEIMEVLRTHGIQFTQLTEEHTWHVETFHLTALQPSDRLNQGHYTNRIEGAFKAEEKSFPGGTILISMAQPLANVAAYLLEPQADDGLLKWNFFDRYLVPQWGAGFYPYPVHRVLDQVE